MIFATFIKQISFDLGQLNEIYVHTKICDFGLELLFIVYAAVRVPGANELTRE